MRFCSLLFYLLFYINNTVVQDPLDPGVAVNFIHKSFVRSSALQTSPVHTSVDIVLINGYTLANAIQQA